jgi:transcriptional regulator with XRE-family HTH domain
MVISAKNSGMDLPEHWRLRLLELKADLGLTQAALASKLEKSPDYVSRLLYEPGKKGRKNLGMQTLRAATQNFNLPSDWFDRPLGTALPSTQGDQVQRRADPPSSISRGATWPFARVTPHQYSLLSSDQREHIEKTILLLLPPDSEIDSRKSAHR